MLPIVTILRWWRWKLSRAGSSSSMITTSNFGCELIPPRQDMASVKLLP